jgi:hypothetical protein
MRTDSSTDRKGRDPVSPWKLGLTWYALSTAVVGYAWWLRPGEPFADYFCRWDGNLYAGICRGCG